MKYLSIDLETTSIDPKRGQVLEIAIICDDTEKPLIIEEMPTFHCYVTHDIYQGDAEALAMNSKTLATIAKQEYLSAWCFPHQEVAPALKDFISKRNFEGHITVAGKNFNSLDKQFLSQYIDVNIFHYRTIDPTIFYWKPIEDKTLPDLKTCLERAGFEGDVKHDALDDARKIIKLIRQIEVQRLSPKQKHLIKTVINMLSEKNAGKNCYSTLFSGLEQISNRKDTETLASTSWGKLALKTLNEAIKILEDGLNG